MLLYFAKENTSNSYHTSTNRRNITFFQPELYSLHVLFSSLLIILGKLEGFFLILWLSIGKVKLLRISKKKNRYFNRTSRQPHNFCGHWLIKNLLPRGATLAVRFLSLVTRVSTPISSTTLQY